MKRFDESSRLIKPGRALFTVVGLKPIFDNPKPLRITQEQFAKALKLEPELHTAIREFVDDKRESFELPPYDYDETRALLFTELSPEDVDKDVSQFNGNPGGDDMFYVASNVREYLKTKVPARLRRVGRFGREPIAAKPSMAELITFRRYLGAATNPLWAIRQLLTATLGREHLETLKTIWPDVLSVCRRAAINATADKIEADEKYQPSRRVARQLSVLLEQPDVPNDFVQKLQATFAQEAEAKNNEDTRQAAQKADDSLETTVQKTAAGNT